MADKIDLAEGCDSFRLANPPPWTACLNYASLEVCIDMLSFNIGILW